MQLNMDSQKPEAGISTFKRWSGNITFCFITKYVRISKNRTVHTHNYGGCRKIVEGTTRVEMLQDNSLFRTTALCYKEYKENKQVTDYLWTCGRKFALYFFVLWCIWRGSAANVNDKPVLSSERVPHTNNPQLSNRNNDLVISHRWMLYSKTDRSTDHRS
jgi:hypothetical protein